MSKEVRNATGFTLNQIVLMADTEKEKPESYIIKMLFKTSPLMVKHQERDINIGMKIGAKPSEIASGLEALAVAIRKNLQDQPATVVAVPPSKAIN